MEVFKLLHSPSKQCDERLVARVALVEGNLGIEVSLEYDFEGSIECVGKALLIDISWVDTEYVCMLGDLDWQMGGEIVEQ